MTKLDEIKKKVKAKGKFNNEVVDHFVSTLEEEVANRITKSSQAELVSKSNELVSEVKALVENHDNGLEKVIKYLEQKEKDGESKKGKVDEGYSRIVHSLNNLAKKSLKVDDTKFVNALNEGMVKLHNVFSDINEVPESGSLQYNAQGKISQITENFEGYRLTTNLRYNNGKVSGWTTKKI